MATLKETRTIFQLPNQGTWFENVAVRSNGIILATRLDVPELWSIDPTTGTGSSLITLPDPIKSLTGIAELRPDVFALGAGQYIMGGSTVPGSWEIWTVNLSGGQVSAPKQIVKIPEAGLINGLTTWDDKTVLAADSEYGKVYKIDVAAGTYTMVLDDETMQSPPGWPTQIGVNGIKVRDGCLYFTNSMRQTMYRVPVDADVKATGPVEALASGFFQDDLAFDEDGTLYVCSNVTNVVVKVAPGSGEGVTIAGDPKSLEVAGGTACAFGRGDGDSRVLYVVTAGAMAMPVMGEMMEPAKVVAVELD